MILSIVRQIFRGSFVLVLLLFAIVSCTTSPETKEDQSDTSEQRSFKSDDPLASAKGGEKPVLNPYLDIAFLIEHSSFVFLGSVSDITTFKDNERNVIATRHIFDIKEVIVGDYSEPTVELSILGGELGGEVMKVSHLPSFNRSELYVVFAAINIETYNPTAGNEYGVFSVLPDMEVVATIGGFLVTGIDDTTIKLGNIPITISGDEDDKKSLAPTRVLEQPTLSGEVVGVQPTRQNGASPLDYQSFADAIRLVAERL